MLQITHARINEAVLTKTFERPKEHHLLEEARPDTVNRARIKAEFVQIPGSALMAPTNSQHSNWVSVHANLPPEDVPPLGENLLVALLPMVPTAAALPNTMDIDHQSDTPRPGHALTIRQRIPTGISTEHGDVTVAQALDLTWDEVEALCSALLVRLADERARSAGSGHSLD